METLEFNVDASANNIRIDRYLADQCPEHSRSYIQKLLKEEQVLVNGRVIKANYKTQSGDYIEFHIPDPEVLDILPENIPLDILYEDDYVLVVNKPKDMVVHPSAGHTSGTLVNAVMAHCGEHLSGINGVLRPGIVHRIDKDTTGAKMMSYTVTLPNSSKNTASNAVIARLCRETSKKMKELSMHLSAVILQTAKKWQSTIKTAKRQSHIIKYLSVLDRQLILNAVWKQVVHTRSVFIWQASDIRFSEILYMVLPKILITFRARHCMQ